MHHHVDLGHYPLDRAGSASWHALVNESKVELRRNGLVSFLGFLRPDSVRTAVAEVQPVLDHSAFDHGAGEMLGWHFDRSEFTTTLLLQAPEDGGSFEYVRDLRSDDDPNYDAVAALLCGRSDQVVHMPLQAGTLNVFRGRNTAHRVTSVKGTVDRIIAVFAYFDRPGVSFSAEERLGFYGRRE